MKISAEILRNKRACKDQVGLFRKTFGDAEVEVTETACLAAAQLFNWHWAAENFLSLPARRVYDEATAPARRAYDEATAPARRAYDEARASAWRAYNETRASAFGRLAEKE